MSRRMKAVLVAVLVAIGLGVSARAARADTFCSVCAAVCPSPLCDFMLCAQQCSGGSPIGS